MMADLNRTGRIDWIDCAKGIGILLVIIGHTVTNDAETIHQAVRGGIFSFHMPLFFIASGLTFRYSENREELVRKAEKSFRHLVVPMLSVYTIRILIDVAKNYKAIAPKAYIIDSINALIFSSGVDVDIAGGRVPALGMLWFVVVLFIARIAIDYAHLKVNSDRQLAAIICVCSIGGVVAGRLQWLPFSSDITLAILSFVWIGIQAKEVLNENSHPAWGLVFMTVWAVTLIATYKSTHTYMELAGRRYPLFPLCYITAIAGAIMIAFISKMMVDCIGAHALGLTWLGRNSMWMYFAHAMDKSITPMWMGIENVLASIVVRIMIDVVVCIIIVSIKGLLDKKRMAKDS